VQCPLGVSLQRPKRPPEMMQTLRKDSKAVYAHFGHSGIEGKKWNFVTSNPRPRPKHKRSVYAIFKKFRPFCKKIQMKGLAENCSRTFLFQLALLNCVAKISATGTALFRNRFSSAATCRALGELLLANKYYAA
jgi:hypothetical protein